MSAAAAGANPEEETMMAGGESAAAGEASSANVQAPEDEVPPPTSSNLNLADARYSFDPEKLQKIRNDKPWTNEVKYFEKVALSPSAIMKMMMHCQSGVDKGIAKGGNPIEVMGMLLGRPDPITPHTLVVTDAFPLPIEGFETRVIADDQDVVNHMISLGECLEVTRKEKFMGWYHSHPFDLEDYSHCFLSQTDLSTQLQWQRAEDPHGNPFVAIVVDPLRSVHTGSPEIKAFRAYPPEYNSPVNNQCPDGSVVYSEQKRLERWGSCWNRYYELGIEYYMSSSARIVMEQLTQDYLWMRTLGSSGRGNSSSNDADYNKNMAEHMNKAANQFKGLDIGGNRITQISSSVSSSGGGGGAAAAAAVGRAFGMSAGAAGSSSIVATSASNKDDAETMKNAVQEIVQLANQELLATSLQKTKQQVFSATK